MKLFRPGARVRDFDALRRAFPQRHFEQLKQQRFPFYRTTFWCPLDRAPDDLVEFILASLRPLANPSPPGD